MIANIVFFFVGVTLSVMATHVLLKIVLIALAFREGTDAFLVTSVKPGRIKFRSRAGRIVKYLANLKSNEGLNHIINERTGEIFEGRGEGENESSLLWKLYGVRWIGLDSVLTFKIEKYDLKGESELEKVTQLAESLYFDGSYLDEAKGLETNDGLSISLTYRVNIQTTHAGRTIRFKYFLPLVLDPIKAKIRDFVASKEIFQLIGQQYEWKLKEGDTTNFLDSILQLNDTTEGSDTTEPKLGLRDYVGQKIISINIMSVGLDQKTKDLIERKKQESIEGKARIERAKNDIKVSEKEAKAKIIKAEAEAKAIELKAKAESEGMKLKLTALNGDTGSLSKIAVGESLRDSKVTTLVTGGDSSVILPTK